MEGKLLGNRYELMKKIGGGGMAIVFKAKCKLLNRFVAVKILRPEFNSDSEFIDRFKIESQAAASLSHPNIVPIYDVGNDDEIHYIVMEYIDGKTLKEYILENGALPWRTAINIAVQICSALEHAHKNHIVHRDIKPHNIIITKELIAKVTDFGIARAATSSTLTMTGSTIGSVHYFSPEQARGGYTDEKSDIYSLGIVLYEMLTGKVPYDGESPITIALRHLEDEIIPPANIANNIPSSINKIVLKAVQKNQANRYQSAAEMLEDLNSALKEPEGDFVKVNDIVADEQPTQRLTIPNKIFNAKEWSSNENVISQGDTNDMAAKKKSDRLTVIAALATSFVIIVIISLLATYYIYSRISNKAVEIKTPDLVGENIETAREMLKQSGITIKEIDRRNDNTVVKDDIISQTPGAGMSIKSPGGEIQVIVSDGQESVNVPDVIGKEQREAVYQLNEEGLLPKEEFEYSSEFLKGFVVRQEPPANSTVSKNTEVKLYISNGPSPKIKVPNLMDMSKDDAIKLLENIGLKLGKVNYSQNISKRNGIILSQSVIPNSEVENTTEIDIVVNNYTIIPPASGEKTRQIPIDLSNINKEGSFNVEARLEGSSTGNKIVYQGIHSRSDNSININVSGKDTARLKVFIDGIEEYEMFVDFDREDM